MVKLNDDNEEDNATEYEEPIPIYNSKFQEDEDPVIIQNNTSEIKSVADKQNNTLEITGVADEDNQGVTRSSDYEYKQSTTHKKQRDTITTPEPEE